MGRPTLNRLGAIPSTRHMKLKLPSMEGAVITIKSDQAEARRCYENSLKQKRSVCHVTTTPPPGVREERSVVRETQGAQRMENAAVEGSQVAQVEEDEAVKARANLNKRSASGTPRWPSMGPRVARLRKEVQTLKKQHVRWHVMRSHLPRGLRARPLSLFAENEFTARDWGACDPIGHR